MPASSRGDSLILQRGPPKVAVWTTGVLGSEIEVGHEVVAFNVSKGIGGASGRWTLDLLPRTMSGVQTVADIRRRAVLYRDLAPNQLVSIGFERTGGIMLGLIDSVRKTRSLVGQTVKYGLRVTGRDMGKALEVDNVVFASVAVETQPAFHAAIAATLGPDHPVVNDMKGTWGPLTPDGVESFLAIKLEDAVQWVLDHCTTLNIPVLAAAAGPGKTPADFITLDVTSMHDDEVWSESLASYEGSVWSFLQSVIDPDLYEIRIDSRPDPLAVLTTALPEVVLIVRPKPFDHPKMDWAKVSESFGTGWEHLGGFATADGSHHEVPEHEVLHEELGRDDADVFSYVDVTMQNELAGSDAAHALGLFYPIVDTAAATRWGMKAYRARSALVAADLSKIANGEGDYGKEIPEATKEVRNRIFNWNRMNAYFEKGSLVVAGRDDFRVGDKLVLPWAIPPIGDKVGMEFYIVGCTWSWSYGGHYTTNLQVTRGHNTEMIDLFDLDTLFTNPANPTGVAET